jgi:hypothetical protein
MTANINIADFNYGVMIAPRGDPLVAEFVDRIPLVHAAAERSEGFVWRYQGDEATDALAIGRPFAGTEPTICSFSVRHTVENFENFLHKTVHGRFLRRRDTWFVPGRSEMVLWNVADGIFPTLSKHLIAWINCAKKVLVMQFSPFLPGKLKTEATSCCTSCRTDCGSPAVSCGKSTLFWVNSSCSPLTLNY